MDQITLSKILFIDIETISQVEDYSKLSDKEKILWDKKSQFLKKDDESSDQIYQKAGIYAEFGKIICISTGFLNFRNQTPEIRIKSFYGEEEQEIIHSFFRLIDQYFNTKDAHLCAHNGKEFDFPYICRRARIHQIPIPEILDVQFKKPWEVQLLDTMNLWKFGDYKNYTSLELLAHVFNIPTPKDDIDGSMVNDVFWKEKNIERIVHYCQKDVVTLIHVFNKLMGNSFPKDVDVIIS